MLKNKAVMEQAIKLAEVWQSRADELVSDFDKKFHVKMNKMLSHPKDKVMLIELMDQSFRSKNTKRVANQIEYLFTKYGLASFFTSSERFLIFLFLNIGIYLPNISIPLFINNIREDTKTVVIKGEDDILNAHLQKRKAEGTRVNINLIGEIVLGEEEAKGRMEKYLKLLENPNVDYISIKISTLFSQINPVSFEDTVSKLVERLSTIFAQAKKFSFTNSKGEQENKFINLDMEEYRDLALTYQAFTETLSQPEFKDFRAGIVLQAYLPDSHLWQQKLIKFAKKRVEDGGVPLKMRLVKGANMEMEETEASLRGWACAPYDKKQDTDSNFKIMAEYGMRKEHIQYLNLGTASHNLFEQAYAYTLAKEYDVLDYYSMEMLEGMSESARLAIKEISTDIILYAPAAKKEQFTNAIAYLVRRLDENTGKENFIRYSFGLKVGSADWEMLKQAFIDSFENASNIFIGAKRQQSRLKENWDDFKNSSFQTGKFTNEPDTDFIMTDNKQWAKDIRAKWMASKDTQHTVVPIVVGGKEISQDRKTQIALDKSQLKDNIIAGEFTLATAEDLQEAVKVAKADVDGWRALSHEKRHEIICNVANEFRKKRGDLVGIAAAEVGKVFGETDVEVSEAIDFLEFYSHAIRHFEAYENLKFEGKGVGVVTPPWNFPIAIPTGGITAALAAGNCVIIKPASAAALSAYQLCQCFWDAGVSKNTLQYLPCPGALAGEHLIKNKDVDFVILTGGEDTAYKMLEARPDLLLTAETGGKDATIVTAMSDREQAIKNVIHSAFSNSGQKCSATSLLILEEEVYNDPGFKSALVDAAKSMETGSVWNFVNRIGTLANPIGGNLKKAIDSLQEGESWALEPEFADDNEYMLKPAIRWGVKDGNFCHMNELFGPVLSVMKAKNLEEAVNIVNKTGYGLTSGLESLDAREVEYWKEHIKAGNLYINRGTTGAVVLRQPFGGMGKSAIGAGRKAGHYNYVTQFSNYEEVATPKTPSVPVGPMHKKIDQWISDAKKGLYTNFTTDFEKLKAALESYLYNFETEFNIEQDYFKLRGEDNIFRYLPLNKVALRVSKDDSVFETISRIMAAHICGVKLHISVDYAESETIAFLFENKDALLKSTDFIAREREEDFVKCFKKVDRILYSDITKVSDFVFEEAAKLATFIIRQKPMMEGRLELLNYLHEQSISHSYHRYGNLGARGIDK
ncbi:bifunctional proline dehydrogenase/L-glutamate gamma-semialdehyde dehydrogenase [Sulfurospirillum sp. 1612]|uniref:bifunctional proline dehydrogenase/L-glutamate gamma-semialdehyde dehydrogenase n=1 Tax=Sulfurospirillum sp. 1612 TaxID=3094835 RepID=UPI002F921335